MRGDSPPARIAGEGNFALRLAGECYRENDDV
jgi:hypothetical protein